MLKKITSAIAVCLVSVATVVAQSGALKVTVKEKETGETIPGAIVTAELNGVPVGKPALTDIDGQIILKPLNAGSYTIKAQYTGRQDVIIKGVVVSADKTSYINMDLAVKTELLKEVEIVEYVKPLIDPDTKSGGTVTRQEYQNMASKNINSVAATTAGVFQKDEGGELNIRGSRSGGSDVYIDGMKVIGTSGVPQSGIEQVSTITGGVPAQYGDITGGIISITTRGPQSQLSGGIELISSQFMPKALSNDGYNFVGFNVGGPIISKKDSTSSIKKPVLGFFISGEYYGEKDRDPSAIGTWVVKSDKLAELEENPIRPSETGSGFVRNAEFLTKDDLEHLRYKPNSASRNLRLNGKLDYKIGNNTNLTLGGSIDRVNQHEFVWIYSLLNAENNPIVTRNTWRVYGKITQRFGAQNLSKEEAEKSSSNLKNAYYSLQASYAKDDFTREDDTHKGNIFDYGYIGKFQHHKTPFYTLFEGSEGLAWYQVATIDTSLTFEASDKNPKGVNWTKAVYEYLGEGHVISQSGASITTGGVTNIPTLQTNLGLANGDRPTNVYSLWYSTGRQYGGRDRVENTQFRVFTNFSGDIKNHQLKLGLEFEQRDNRQFQVVPIGIWTIMRQLTNFHLQQLDTVPILVPELSGTLNYYRFDRKYDEASQTFFDKSLREKLGYAENSTNWIDIDSYDPSTFSLDMFSADELLQEAGNNRLVTYYGYDHTGKKLTGNPTLEDFFNKQDENGNFTRSVPSFRPIYMAGYIEDNFDFKDLKFRVGVRVDRYDANQKVLKDKYVFDEVYTAAETNFSLLNSVRPSNIGDEYVVYVNDVKNPTSVVGYRNEDTWYNANGTEISNPELLETATGIAPYLVDPNNTQKISAKGFKDYEPQVNVMPRVAFSFPISDMANFFAHYDILTQRPDEGFNRLDIVGLYFMEARGGAYVNNPSLRPERTTDYELGFSQILSEKKNSALTLSAFYRELRDMIQVVKINGAYPLDYLTMGNIDFGTVKGFSVAYDLRRTAGVQLGANYTLQFADGTGSSASDGFNLANSGMPNLRTTVPLDFDQRHTIVTTFDYRFGSGADYRGPNYTSKKGGEEKTKQVLANMGANVVMRAGSGTPYSRQANATQGDGNVAVGVSQRSALKGSIKGSQLPWTFRADLRVDKNFKVTWGGKGNASEDAASNKKVSNLNVYIQVLNVLNSKNVLNVYRYTGNPDDDGYLAAPEFQSLINTQTDPNSYRDLYSVKVSDPNFYSIPRRTRIGLTLDF